ncbi:MAG: carbohydrate kinase [Pseudomonadota bacterium]|nr:carbohydrate kinase [Pseudomonadota bacterium]
MADILIGIDAGTSLIKSIAFDLDGRQLAVASTPNRYQTRPDGAAFQSLDDTWEDCAKTLRELAGQVANLAQRTAAIGVTGQGDGTWLVDKNNNPVTEAWLWLDGRAGPTVRRLRGAAGDRARYLATGTGLNVCQQGSQLAHMKATTPEIVAGADAAMHCKDWLYLNLTGVRATDPSEACFTFGDFRTRAYDDGVIAALGLERERRLLPPILDGVATTHPLSAGAAAVSGLTAGTPVSLGYVDVVCTALGAGILSDGAPARCTIIGSTGMHMRAAPASEAYLNDDGTGYTMTLPIPGMIAQMQSNMAATLNIDWILGLAGDLFASLGHTVSKRELIDRIEGWVGATRPGSLLFHPYISEAGERGPFVNNHARAGFNGLSFSHRFPDLVRGVIEGLSFAARDCYEAMGRSHSEVRLTGGAGRSKALRAILAACLDAPVRVSSREEAGAAGAAMIAACAIGAYADMNAAIARWVTPALGAAEPPDPALVKVYASLFPAYLETRRALEPVWDCLVQKD